MKKYLVISFDRYDSKKSANHFVKATSPVEAYKTAFAVEDEDEMIWVADVIVNVDHLFSVIEGEEIEYLIYEI